MQWSSWWIPLGDLGWRWHLFEFWEKLEMFDLVIIMFHHFPMEIAISWGYTTSDWDPDIGNVWYECTQCRPMPICFLSEDASNTTCRFEWTNCHRFLGIIMIAAYINLCIYLLSMSILYVYLSIYCRFFLSIFLIYLSFQSIYLTLSNLSFQSIKATYPASRHQIPQKYRAWHRRQELSLPEAHGDGQPSAAGGGRSGVPPDGDFFGVARCFFIRNWPVKNVEKCGKQKVKMWG